MSPPFTLPSVLERHALDPRRRDRPAVSMGDDVRSFGAVHERSVRLAHGLRGLGVRAGDRVAVLMGNRPEWVEALLGITAAGAVCVPVNVLFDAADVATILGDADPALLVVDALAGPAIAGGDGLPPVLVVGDEAVETPPGCVRHGYEELLAAGTTGRVGPLGHVVEPTAPAMMYYTSGTTGAPKGVVHTHHGVLWNTAHQIPDLEIGEDETFLVVPSLSWSAGFHDVTLATLWAGGTVELLGTGRGALDRIVDTVERVGVTRALIVPTLLRGLLDAPPMLERLRRSALTRVMSGAEPLPAAVTEPFAEVLPGAAITQTYGLTEFPMIATVVRPEEAVTRAGSAGRASTITTLAVEVDGEAAPRGEGEILLRSPATMSGYFRRPDADAEAFRDGWFHTGDLGEVDDDGFLTVTGRLKDVIISGGMNIAPREIEDLIARCPGVREVAVVGLADDRWGETPVAVVVGDGVDTAAVHERCAGLSRFKRPSQVLLRDDPLPKTVTGKILKRELRTQLASDPGGTP